MSDAATRANAARRLPVRWFAGAFLLSPDASRAVRATLAFMVPLLLAFAGVISIEVSFASVAAQNLAMVDLRGDYRVRFLLLLAMAAVFVGAAALGAAAGGALGWALLAALAMVLASGAWRHLSNDYGPPLAISSMFVFLFALSTRGEPGALRAHVIAAACGAGWGVLLQIAHWPVRPQHALRRSVADSWVAVSDLLVELGRVAPEAAIAQSPLVPEREAAVRAALDAAYATLEHAPAGALRERLGTLNSAAARLATLGVSLHTTLEATLPPERRAALAPALEPVTTALANLARSVAITAVSRHDGHLAIAEVRGRRLRSLLRVLEARCTAEAEPREIIRQLGAHLAAIETALRATVDPVDAAAATSLELRDLRALALRPLASVLNLTWAIDPALVRYTLRLAVLTLAGVAVFKTWDFPHGYWLPFTVAVVLQPDYGSTRQRAAQRVLGTIAGSVLASAFLWLQLPPAALIVAAGATMFAFGYWVKRDYAVAIFFITLFIVLLTGLTERVTLALTLERVISTAIGGAVALGAAQLFWPMWERDRFPPLLAAAFRANRDYLRLLLARLATGGAFDAEAIRAKRAAEAASSAAFSSLRRLSGDPGNQREGLEHLATLANGNQRLTRALNVLVLHVTAPDAIRPTTLVRFGQLATQGLELLAHAVEHPGAPLGASEALLRELEGELFPPEPAGDRERWVFAQLARAATELAAPARAGDGA
jgi:uncharacterized membrane protein YccC